MKILENASTQQLKRLLELFPASNLREKWPKQKGSKEEIAATIAQGNSTEELIKYVDENLSCCKQHVNVFIHEPPLEVVPEFDHPDAGMIASVKGLHRLYIIKARYKVILNTPWEETFIEFLWPIRVELNGKYTIVRFVTLEKDIKAHFDTRYQLADRLIDEKTILDSLSWQVKSEFGLADLHKGFKKLWDSGFMDAIRVRYKKPLSTASEDMDEEKGIRENNQELYAILKKAKMFNTLCIVPGNQACSVTAFHVNPSAGSVSFPRYSEKRGDTDHVIREILKHN